MNSVRLKISLYIEAYDQLSTTDYEAFRIVHSHIEDSSIHELSVEFYETFLTMSECKIFYMN